MLISSSSAVISRTVQTKNIQYQNRMDGGGSLLTIVGFDPITQTSDFIKVEFESEGSGGIGGLKAARIYGIQLRWKFYTNMQFDTLKYVKFNFVITTYYTSRSYEVDAYDENGMGNFREGVVNVGLKDWLTITPTHSWVQVSFTMEVDYHDWWFFWGIDRTELLTSITYTF